MKIMKKRTALFLLLCAAVTLVCAVPALAWTDGPSIVNTGASSEDFDYESEMAFDNDDETMWHTQWREEGEMGVYPQSVIAELDNVYWIDCIGYLPRQDGSANGSALEYEVWVSATGSVNDHATDAGWTKIASGAWDEFDIMDWREEGTGEFFNVEFDAVEAKLIKFVILDGIGGWSSAAAIELGFLGVNYTPMAGFTPRSAPGTAAPAAAEPEPAAAEPAPAAAEAPAAVVEAPPPAAAAAAPAPQTNDGIAIMVFSIIFLTAACLISYSKIARTAVE